MQLKTGHESLTAENVSAIERDIALLEQGYTVEWVLEQGGSLPLIYKLTSSGIRVYVGRMVP
jgi:hypothetical protein